MKLAPQYEFTESQHEVLRKARRLAWFSIAYLASVIYLMYLVMGSSQAMKTAWVEDCLGLIPPLCFLAGTYICWRRPTQHYPYGFHRAVSILFLCASLALLVMGGLLFGDSLLKLATHVHPSIGMKAFFGIDTWSGWWMILALLWGTFPPIVIGRLKIRYARALNDKILITDGKMNKADWLTAVAAIFGILGIGMGWWWADLAAAAFIALDILRDGWSQTADAVTGLMNRAPTSLEGRYLNLPSKIRKTLVRHDWVASVDVRLYEHGHLFFGEGFVKLRPGHSVSPALLQTATNEIRALDWRLQGFILTVAPKEEENPPRRPRQRRNPRHRSPHNHGHGAALHG